MPRRSIAVAAVLVGTLALAACGSSSDGSTMSVGSSAGATTPAAATSAPAASASSGSAAQAGPAGSVTFNGVTVANPTDLNSKPQVTSAGTVTPAKLEYKDLVVGTGASANPSSYVNVQYDGFIYKDGKQFDASWDNGGQPIGFSLTQVVPGFTQGIGGITGVPPMKVGGRRIMILPAALGYPDGTSDGSIPPNTPIVFIVDLVSLS